MKNKLYPLALFLAISTAYASTAYTQTINTVVGNGIATFGGDSGPATSASIHSNTAVHFDSIGNMFIADAANNRIRKVNTSGIITTVAGTGIAGSGGDAGPATNAQLNNPSDVAFDAAGNMYITDYLNNRIRKVDASGTITTIAGTGTSGATGDGGPATAAKLFHPQSLIIDASGKLFFCDEGNDRVRMINTSGIILLYAGSGTSGVGDGGPATNATLSRPGGITINHFGSIVFSDAQHNRIREVNASGIISTIAGTGSAGFSGDSGPATAAKINQPSSLCIDNVGNIFLADGNNNRVRKIDTFGNISTVAGNGSAGFSGDSGPATAASLHGPSGLCIENFSLYIGDATNNRVRSVGCVSPVFATAIVWADSICPGDTFHFACTPTGGTWSTYHSTISTVSASGVVTGVGGGMDTVKYVYSNVCGSDSVIFPLKVRTAAACGLGVINLAADENNILISPNPGLGHFTLSYSSHEKGTITVCIYNVLGRKIKELDMTPNTPAEVNIDAPAGMYLVTANSDTYRLTSKLLIQ